MISKLIKNSNREKINYKNIITSFCVLPLTLIGFNQKQLIEAQKATEKELSSLVVLINEKENIVDILLKNLRTVYADLLAELSGDELEACEKSVSSFQISLLESIRLNKNIEELLNTQLIAGENNFLLLKRIKFNIINYYSEYALLHDLINKYESVLKKLLIIKNQLNHYEK